MPATRTLLGSRMLRRRNQALETMPSFAPSAAARSQSMRLTRRGLMSLSYGSVTERVGATFKERAAWQCGFGRTSPTGYAAGVFW